MITKNDSTFNAIAAVIEQLYTERGDPAPEVQPDTRFSALNLDSLDIASLVVRLEESLGVDPFASGRVTEFPRTIAELTSLYGDRT